MISKKIERGELLIDFDKGVIWVNAPNCILKISGLHLKDLDKPLGDIESVVISVALTAGLSISYNGGFEGETT